MMGMLWFDNDEKTDLATKIARAADYYTKKYGAKPNYCVVNPTMADRSAEEVEGIKVDASRIVLPHHLWLGRQG